MVTKAVRHIVSNLRAGLIFNFLDHAGCHDRFPKCSFNCKSVMCIHLDIPLLNHCWQISVLTRKPFIPFIICIFILAYIKLWIAITEDPIPLSFTVHWSTPLSLPSLGIDRSPLVLALLCWVNFVCSSYPTSDSPHLAHSLAFSDRLRGTWQVFHVNSDASLVFCQYRVLPVKVQG